MEEKALNSKIRFSARIQTVLVGLIAATIILISIQHIKINALRSEHEKISGQIDSVVRKLNDVSNRLDIIDSHLSGQLYDIGEKLGIP
jgi:uncharacterized membrane protein YgaE (UPF0421/DUF939 family)